MFKDADCKTVPWEWRINLSLSNLSQEPHPAFVLAKASLDLIVFWENGTEWYKIISHPPQAQLHVNLYSLMATHKNSVVSFLQPVPSIMDEGRVHHSPLATFVFWLWDSFHSLTLLISTACSGGIGMFSSTRVKDILHHHQDILRKMPELQNLRSCPVCWNLVGELLFWAQ